MKKIERIVILSVRVNSGC